MNTTNKNFNNCLSLLLKVKRRERHMSQYQLAQLMNIDKSLISKHESFNNPVTPSLPMFIRYCKYLNINNHDMEKFYDCYEQF